MKDAEVVICFLMNRIFSMSVLLSCRNLFGC